jgi:MFS transporter, PAT family, beta-lactamase induction signal transducer AmpG
MVLADYASAFRSRKIGLLLLLGFASGLPLALTAGTLQAWLAAENVDIVAIGWFALVGQPYTYKFLWSPLMDRFTPLPALGRRRGWLLLTQLALVAAIGFMGTLKPADSAWLLGATALAVAFLSASQDIVFDALRADLLERDERGAGAAVSVLGYRVAMLVSGAGALILADQGLGWSGTYWLMAALMGVGLAASWLVVEPEGGAAPRTLDEAVVKPFAEFFSRQGALALLVLVVLYKLGDAFAGNLTTTFLLRGPGFSLTEIGAINKGFGLAATIVGALAGGALMAKMRLYRALLLFGVLQALTNLGFMLLAASGKSYALMVAVIGLENLCGGMGTTAYVALLMALCDRRFSATQYALLSALSSVGRVYVGPVAGYLVAGFGWQPFFFFSFLIALPGLALLIWARERIDNLDASR